MPLSFWAQGVFKSSAMFKALPLRPEKRPVLGYLAHRVRFGGNQEDADHKGLCVQDEMGHLGAGRQEEGHLEEGPLEGWRGLVAHPPIHACQGGWVDVVP